MNNVTHQPTQDRYQITADDTVAGFAAYVMRGERIHFTHTEVSDYFQGRGLAKELAAHALADVVARGLTIVPDCPYIARYLDRHEVPGATVEPPRQR